MKKSIVSLILVFSLVITLIAVPVYADEENVLTKGEEYIHLSALGVLDDFSSYLDDTIVTRGEFAAMVIRLLNLKDSIGEPTEYSYLDVSDEYPYYREIYHCTKLGLLGGVGDGYFMPNAPIETNHAIKVLVSALGYGYLADANGGYPTGYMFAANNLNLLRGIDLKADGLTFKSVIKLLYNALFVDLMQVTGVTANENVYSTVPGENILTNYFKLNVKKGVVDGIYGLSAGTVSSLDMYQISIDSVVFEGTKDYSEYFGYNVSVFYSIKEENLGEIFSLSENSDKNNVVKIDFENVTGGALNSFSYEDDKERTETENIDVDIEIIYNRELKLDFDFSIINKNKRGSIYLIDNTGDKKKDIVVIADYETYIVEKVTEESITDRFGKAPIDITDTGRKLFIKDSDDNIVGLSSITKNSVLLVIKTPKFVEIVVSNEKIKGTITGYSDNEFTVDGVNCKFSPVVNNKTPDLNETYTIYFDAGKKIVLLELMAKDGYTFAYFTKSREPKHEADSGWLKMFTEDGEFIDFEIADKLIVNGKKYEVYEFKTMLRQFEKNGEFIPQLVKIKSEEDKLLEIKTAKDSISSTEDGFVKGIGEHNAGVKLPYEGINTNFGGKAFVTATTKIFQVPDKDNLAKATDSDYQIIKTSQLSDNTNYSVASYYNSKDNFICDAAVVFSLSADLGKITQQTVGGVYLRSFTGVDSEGASGTKCEFLTSDGVESFFTDELIDDISHLKKGDTVRILTSGEKLISVETVYRRDDKLFPGDTTDKNYNSAIRFVFGKVSYLNDKYMRLSYDGSVYDDSTNLTLEGFVLSGSVLYIKVEERNGNKFIEKTTVDDITRESEVLVQQYNGQVKLVVIYK